MLFHGLGMIEGGERRRESFFVIELFPRSQKEIKGKCGKPFDETSLNNIKQRGEII